MCISCLTLILLSCFALHVELHTYCTCYAFIRSFSKSKARKFERDGAAGDSEPPAKVSGLTTTVLDNRYM